MLVNTPTNYSINHCGYLKDQRFLLHNLRKAEFKLGNSRTKENLYNYEQAQRAISNFYRNNSFKAFLFNIPNRLMKSFRSPFYQDKKLHISTNAATNSFNNLVFEYEGKKYFYHEFKKRISDEKDFQKKEKMNFILKKQLNTMQDIVRDLVNKRNNFAKQKGFKNYYQYILEKLFKTTEIEIDNSIEKYYLENNIISALRERERIIAEKNNLKINDLTDSHKKNPLYFSSGINDYIKTPKQVINIAKRAFTTMGYGIEQLEKDERIIFDLDMSSKKINSAFCRPLVPGYSVGISTRTNGNTYSLLQLVHEMGHGVHELNTFKWLPHSLKGPHTYITEAVALMFESLVYKENLLKGSVPEPVIEKFKELKQLDEDSIFANLAIMAQFEKELYRNPNQDFEELFSKIERKYYGSQRGSEWFVPHLITNPGYIQNYIRASVLEKEIYSATRNKLGTELSSSPHTAGFLNKRVFGLGKLVNNTTLKILLKL